MKCPNQFIISTQESIIEVECNRKLGHPGKCQANLYSFKSNCVSTIKWEKRNKASDPICKKGHTVCV